MTEKKEPIVGECIHCKEIVPLVRTWKGSDGTIRGYCAKDQSKTMSGIPRAKHIKGKIGTHTRRSKR